MDQAVSKSELATRERYSEGAKQRVEALCCPVSYDGSLLEVIPAEVIERDYGCGDPSKYVSSGQTVLDLGSGSGKICFIAAQVVGETGKVIGVDMNEDMLALARRNAPIVAERIGYANVEFREGRIQDMRPIVDDGSVDVVVSNCVLNLVDGAEKRALFGEIFRVLVADGCAVISDIVCAADVPVHMQEDPELWSGCISGALREDLFPQAFLDAGFTEVEVLDRQESPWKVVEDIEFRSLTVAAYKGAKKKSACCG